MSENLVVVVCLGKAVFLLFSPELLLMIDLELN
jgi:hypothetical protein